MWTYVEILKGAVIYADDRCDFCYRVVEKETKKRFYSFPDLAQAEQLAERIDQLYPYALKKEALDRDLEVIYLVKIYRTSYYQEVLSVSTDYSIASMNFLLLAIEPETNWNSIELEVWKSGMKVEDPRSICLRYDRKS